jgi:Ser/Thr protein kinase RdoA (MazF antagonist)
MKRIFRLGPSAHSALVTKRLRSSGIDAPPTWLHGRESSTGRELLVTPRAPGKGPLLTLAAVAHSPQQKWTLLRALGAEIGRLHQAGFVHGDLTPFNIFSVANQQPHFVFLDHERTRKNFFLGSRRRQLRNFVQLGRFNLPNLTRSDRIRLLDAYCANMPWRERESIIRQVAIMLQRRIIRDGGFQVVEKWQPTVKREKSA